MYVENQNKHIMKKNIKFTGIFYSKKNTEDRFISYNILHFIYFLLTYLILLLQAHLLLKVLGNE